MKNVKLLLLTCLLTLVGWNATAQRVIGYHQGTNNSKLQSWYWDYVTDVNYSFLQVGSNGQVGLGANGGSDSFQEGLFAAFVTTAKSQGKRITISVGGADKVQAQNFKNNSATYAKAKAFATNVVTWAKNKGLDGVDIDWEPEGTTGKPTSTEWENLLKAFRDVITTNAPTMELTAAIFPYKWNNDFILASSHQYVDHFNLMVYDFGAPDYPHHSNYVPNADLVYGGKTVEEACISYWNKTKGLAKDKMVLGLPFYGRSRTWQYSQNDYKSYRDIVGTSTALAAKDESGTMMYNGQPTIKRKTKYAIDNGLKGVMMWELTGDATTKAVSLLAAIDEEITAAGCPKPNLGDDQNICTKASITLDASLSVSDYNFSWYKDNQKQSGTSKTFDAKAPGTYKVIAQKKGTACSQENVIILTKTYPELDLVDVPLCGAGDALDVDATIVGFEGMTYKWTGAGTASTAKISVDKVGDYTITVSDPAGHCETKTKTIAATESKVTVKGDTACVSGDEVKLKILDPGTYSWWDAKTAGTQLGTLDSLYQKITKTTPFYVQKTGGAVQYEVGLKYDHTAPANAWSGPGNGDYEYDWQAPKVADDTRLYFSALQDLTIDEAVVHMNLGDGADFNGTFNVCLYSSEHKEIECKEVFLEANGKGTVKLGISVAAGNYYLGIPDAKQWTEKYTWDADLNAPSGTFDYPSFGIDGVMTWNTAVSKTTGDYAQAADSWYAGFYDMKISTGKPCPRVEVFGVLDELNKKCIKIAPDVTITAPTDNYKMGPTDNVSLIASATDQDGTVASVKFVIKNAQGGIVKELISTNTSTPYGVSLDGLSVGTYTVTAVATDDQGTLGISTSITIVVGADNKLPTIMFLTPSDNAELPLGATASLSVLAEDPDGEADLDKVVYVIKKGTTVIKTLESTTPGDLFSQSWVGDDAGTYTIEATVYDKAGATASATITVIIKGNSSPIVKITSPTDKSSFDINSTINITATASDQDGSVVKVEYLIKFQGQDVTTKVGSGGNYTTSFVADKVGEYTIIATATDDKGATSTDFVEIIINAGKADPTVVITSPTDKAFVNQNSTVNLTANATDTDGTISKVEYSIMFGGSEVNKLTGSGSNYSASFVADQLGVYTIIATATDNDGLTATSQITITVDKPNEDPIITIVEPANTSVKLPNNVNFDVTAIDNDGSIASVTINIDNKDLTISNSGNSYTSTWNTTGVTAGKYTATIVATDNKGGKVTKTLEITILSVDANLPPTIVIVKPTNTITILTTDVADIQTKITDDGSVASVTIDGKAVTASGDNYNTTFSSTTAGTFNIDVVATDDKGEKSTKTITIIVEKPNEDPIVVITSPTDGQSITITKGNTNIPIIATVTDDGTVTVVVKVNNSIVSNTNSGNTYTANYNATTGGSLTATVTATDNKGVVVTKTVTFTVVDNVNTDAVISTITVDKDPIRIDDAVTISVNATDDEGVQSLKMTVTDDKGIVTTVSSSTSGSATGTWSTTTAGTYTITVTVTDNKGNVTTKTKTITVLAGNQSPLITLNPIKSNNVVVSGELAMNSKIDLSATASDPDGTISAVYYEISIDGVLVSRIKTTSAPYAKTYTASKPGTYTVIAHTTDADGVKVTTDPQTFVISVDPNAIAEGNAIKLNYTVFPNPAADNATISFELEEGAETNVVIYNAQGNVVATVINEELTATTHTFDVNVSELPAGLYFIQLTTGDTLAIQRLIVE